MRRNGRAEPTAVRVASSSLRVSNAQRQLPDAGSINDFGKTSVMSDSNQQPCEPSFGLAPAHRMPFAAVFAFECPHCRGTISRPDPCEGIALMSADVASCGDDRAPRQIGTPNPRRGSPRRSTHRPAPVRRITPVPPQTSVGIVLRHVTARSMFTVQQGPLQHPWETRRTHQRADCAD